MNHSSNTVVLFGHRGVYREVTRLRWCRISAKNSDIAKTKFDMHPRYQKASYCEGMVQILFFLNWSRVLRVKFLLFIFSFKSLESNFEMYLPRKTQFCCVFDSSKSLKPHCYFQLETMQCVSVCVL